MGVHGQKIPKNANIICQRPLTYCGSRKNFVPDKKMVCIQ